MVIFFLALVASVSTQSLEFEEFQVMHNKVYKDQIELRARQRIFEENKNIIDEHNERYAKGLVTFQMGINKFTDLTSSEFRNRLLSNHKTNKLARKYKYQGSRYNDSIESMDIPKSINWFDKGAVTGVSDQLNCKADWAFAAIGSLEGQYFLKYNQLLDFSVQNLLDCSSNDDYGNQGCIKGSPEQALEYVIKHGIQLGSSYIYEGHESVCRHRENYNVKAQVKDIEYIHPPNDEILLAKKLANYGPITVSINGTHLQSYMRGVIHVNCNNNADLSLTLVGYGSDTYSGDYWLLKNSWGTSWGENGYLRLARNKGNMCGIASAALIPRFK